MFKELEEGKGGWIRMGGEEGGECGQDWIMKNFVDFVKELKFFPLIITETHLKFWAEV